MSRHKKIVTAGIFLSFIWIGVSAISRGIFVKQGFYYDVPNQNMPTVIFLILFSIAFFIYFALSFDITKRRTDKGTFFAIVFFACLFRIILLPSVPVHENDIYRYIWDGKVTLSGINPYAHAPQEAEIKPEGNKRIKDFTKLKSLRDSNRVYFSRIGHRRVPTIYPPFAQAIFSIAGLIREDSIFVMKSIFVIFDILVVIVISKLLLLFNKDPSLSIIYAWSPLVLKEIANSGHYDSIAIFTMLLALYFLFSGKYFKGVISFAAAAASKFFPILLLPLYKGALKLRYYAIFALLLLVSYLPFFLWQNTGAAQVFKGLFIYSKEWAYNGSVFVFFKSIFDALNIKIYSDLFLPKLAVGLIFIAALVFLSMNRIDNKLSVMHKSFVILALLFGLSPVGDPWYFCWVIPFLCFFHYYSFIILSWLLIFSYLSFSREFGAFSIGALELPVLNMLQYIPFFILFTLEIFIRKKRGLNLSYVQ